jgi:hypothetical protein
MGSLHSPKCLPISRSLIIPENSLLACKVIEPQVLGISMWIFWGDHYSICLIVLKKCDTNCMLKTTQWSYSFYFIYEKYTYKYKKWQSLSVLCIQSAFHVKILIILVLHLRKIPLHTIQQPFSNKPLLHVTITLSRI